MSIIYKDGIPDTSSYFDLYQSTGWNKYYKVDHKEIEKALANTWYSVCAYSGAQLVGFGRVLSDGVFYGIICDMIVAPDYQRKGIGSEIIKMLKKSA